MCVCCLQVWFCAGMCVSWGVWRQESASATWECHSHYRSAIRLLNTLSAEQTQPDFEILLSISEMSLWGFWICQNEPVYHYNLNAFDAHFIWASVRLLVRFKSRKRWVWFTAPPLARFGETLHHANDHRHVWGFINRAPIVPHSAGSHTRTRIKSRLRAPRLKSTTARQLQSSS